MPWSLGEGRACIKCKFDGLGYPANLKLLLLGPLLIVFLKGGRGCMKCNLDVLGYVGKVKLHFWTPSSSYVSKTSWRGAFNVTSMCWGTRARGGFVVDDMMVCFDVT